AVRGAPFRALFLRDGIGRAYFRGREAVALMPTDPTHRKNIIRQYRDNLRREVDSVALYRALSVEERQPELAEVYKRLASIEEAHQQFWTRRLSDLGHQTPEYPVGWRTRTLI